MAENLPVALTIAGSDSGGGAGIQADLATFRACGCFGVSTITCLTAQNPNEVRAVQETEGTVLSEQLLAVSDYFQLGACKTGMLLNARIVRQVSDFLKDQNDLPIVVDPVLVATSGAVLLEQDAIEEMIHSLFPLATLITPNLDEARVLMDVASISSDQMEDAAREFTQKFGRPVLLKGGHLPGDKLLDVYACPEGALRVFNNSRHANINTHGSGCTLSSAIAAFIARGENPETSIEKGLQFMATAFSQALSLNHTKFLNNSPSSLGCS